MRTRTKRSKSTRHRWLKRSDYIFLGFFIFLIIASILVSHLPHSSLAAQAPILSNNSLSSTYSASSATSVSSGGYGGLGSGTKTNPSQAPAPNVNKTTGPTTSAQPQQAGASQDIVDDWLIGNSGLLGWTDPGITFANPQIKIAWGSIVGMADLFLVLFIMINGIRVTMSGIGFRYADAVESLPRIALAFVTANLSWYFVACLIGINNDMCAGILVIAQKYNLAYTGGVTVTELINQAITIVVEIAGIIISNFIPVVGQIIGIVSIAALVGSILVALVELTEFILYLFLMIQLIIRIALINFLLILAPLGLASWALPQGAGQQLMRVWLNAIFASIFVQFLQLTCYTFGFLLLNPVSWATSIQQHTPVIGFLGIDPGVLFKIAILWITLRVPSLVQNVTTNMMGEGSRNASSMISQAIGTATSAVSTAAIAMR